MIIPLGFETSSMKVNTSMNSLLVITDTDNQLLSPSGYV